VRAAAWLAENFVIPSGQHEGEPFELHEFQLDLFRAYLSRDHDGPTFRTVIFTTPRKLGKSTLLAALLLCLMCPDSPLYVRGFRGAVAAPSEKHARWIAEAMRSLADAAGRGDDVETKTNPRPGVIHAHDGQVILSTGTRAQCHGADLDLAIIDEAGLIAGQKSNGLISGFYDALSARNGQLILTGTRGDAAEYNELIETPDIRTKVILHGASKDDDPADPAIWEKANPDGGRIKPRRFLQDACQKAQAGGSLAEFQAWQLNVPLSPSRELLLDYDTLKKAYRPDPQPIPGEPCHIGIDLGGPASMTAAVVAYESGVIRLIGAFPGADMDLRARGKRDLVGDLWARCADAGELFETSGSVSDLQEFIPEVLNLIGPHPVRSVSCDRYRQHEFETALARARIDWPVIYRGTGPKDGDQDIRATRKLFLAGAVTLRRSLLLEGSLGEADVKVSTTGAVQLDKSHIHARIDVAQALCLACSALLRARDEVTPEYTVEVL
jgi:phage terminase large subunit-like protein